MPDAKSILYVTADGLLEPIGFSQVVRVVEGLVRRGWQYEIISLERRSDLDDQGRVRALHERLASSRIAWRYHPYRTGGTARAAVSNELALVQSVARRTREQRFSAVHARAYHGAVAGLAARLAARTPFLFDARSYWFDERLEEGRWLTSPARIAVARRVERALFTRAAGVVTLTELQADDVRSGKFGTPPRSVRCITTCADFEEFARRSPEQCTRVPESVRARFRGKLVLGIVGSINASYLVDESLRLAKLVVELEPRAHLLIVSRQTKEFEARVERAGIAPSRVVITSAEHQAMPEWLSLIDWGLLLLNPSSPAKRASMPTKLGEFFAAGVRPVQFGCNREVTDWVRRTQSGFVLEQTGEPDLRAAAERIASTPVDPAAAERARSTAESHFSLASGLEKYDRVLRAVALGEHASI
jgi:hypothetical protein